MYSEQVRAGMELLDKHCNNWREKISVDRLDMYDSCDCILGQVFENYSNGLQYFDKIYGVYNWDLICSHGFSLHFVHSDMDERRKAYNELTAEWKLQLTGE